MTIQNNGSNRNDWTLTVWARNLLPPTYGLRSTLFRGQGLQTTRDYDRYLVVRGSDRTLCFLTEMMKLTIIVIDQPDMKSTTSLFRVASFCGCCF